MVRPALFAAAAALLALTACDRIPFLNDGDAEANEVAANKAAGNASAEARSGDAGITTSRSLAGLGTPSATGGKDPGAVQAGSGAVDPRLVGRWTDSGDCKTVMELAPDGTFLASNGVTGEWRVDGDQLVFTGNGNVVRLRIDSIEADRVVTTNAQGQSGPSTRC